MDRTTKYAESVVNGTIDRNVGHTEYLACKRHLNDLERQGTEDFPFVFDEKKSLEIIDFAENLTLAEGTPAPFRCKGFQDFVFGSWQGWIRKDNGFRRFKTSYQQLARQNGKSVGNSVPSMFYGNFAGYRYPQVYAVATKEDQARIVLKECNKFIEADKELCGTKTKKGLFTIQDYRSRILCNITRGEIRALGRDTETIDGFRPYFGSVDEYHKHKTNQMYKLLVDGCKNLDEYLISVITTAGFDLNSPCKELYDYCKAVLSGAIADETQFVFITELNKGDDIWNEDNWSKANPLWTPRRLENLRADAVKAKEMGGEELRNFQTKSLNIWVQAADMQYINAEAWANCGDGTTLEDMRGKECYLGLDLSSGGDLTSGALEFPLEISGRKKHYIDSHSFLPAKRLDGHLKSDKAPYLDWVKRGLIPCSLAAKLTGKPYDTAKGMLYDTGSAENTPWAALMGRMGLGDGGYRYFSYLKGKFAVGSQTARTREADITPNTVQLTYSAVVTEHEFQLDENTVGGAKGVFADTTDEAFTTADTWFDSVATPPEVTEGP